MNLSQFKDSTGQGLQMLKNNLQMMDDILANLPEIPDYAAYIGLETFPFPEVAQFMLRLQVKTREQAVEIYRLFRPMLAVFSQQIPVPYFRPMNRIPLDDLNRFDFAEVFPAIFTSFLQVGLEVKDGRYTSQLVWYHEPIPMTPGVMAIIACQITEDEAKVFEDYGDFECMPPSDLQIEDKEVTQGQKTISCIWHKLNQHFSLEDWQKLFVGYSLDESDDWADIIG